MKAVISVIGKDRIGILSKVCDICAQRNINVVEATQSILEDLFAMIMVADISQMTCKLSDFSDEMNQLGESLGLSIRVMHEDIFQSMHRI